MALERVQKLIARAGVCSRRDAEDRIREGRVTINGRVAELGDQADPATDAIKVDGKRLKAEAPARYVLLNKPVGVVTTTEDPEGRTTVIDLIRPKVGGRLFPVGRLDYASEGLVLLTNDGDLALKVSHPRYGVLREYMVKVRGVPSDGERGRLAAGTVIEGQKVVPQEVSQIRVTSTGVNSWWKVVVGEGKTHEVREMFKRIGHPVQRLIRVAIGPLRDSELKPGAFRDLTEGEVDLLRRGGRQGGRPDERTTGSRVHPQARRLRSGEADRGGAAGARGQRHRQAGVEREPARHVAKGARRDPRRAS
jgi:23S rRNA pseudouridine2605 synthase